MQGTDIALRFEEIYRTTNKAILTYITVKCGRVSDVNDLFQDTYLELYQILQKSGPEYVTNEKALALKIAKLKISKYYTLKEKLKNFISAIDVQGDGKEEDLTENEADPFLLEEYVINQVLLDSIRQFIQEKPEDIKKIFYLYYDVGLKISEIASVLAISESSVKNKLYRTIRQLKNIVETGDIL